MEGFVPFPPVYAAMCRARGYWEDRTLAQEFAVVFGRYATRTAVIDGDRRYSYDDIDRLSDRLALNLLALGLSIRQAAVLQLPNVVEFVILYFALQKLGAIPIAALASHRYAEVSQFVGIAAATACFYPARQGDFAFASTIARIAAEAPSLTLRVVLGEAGPGEHSLVELIEREPSLPLAALQSIVLDPDDPAIFQLSGGTTGVPKLIPRTHNDYAYNSRQAASVCGVTAASVLLLVIPIAHNLALACPGIQGYFLNGGHVVVSTSTRPEEMLRLIEKHRVTHLKVVPALLIRLINCPSIRDFDLGSLRVIQSGGQRMQPEVRLRTKELIPSVTVQENFGMSEGMLFFVRLDDPEDVRLETCGRPICPDDEVRLVDDDGREVAPGQVGELTCRGPYTLRGYYRSPAYNARQFTSDGFYCSGDLMREHPTGNYVVEGRKKDLINRGGEKISAEEIENLILMHPAVQNVACVAVPDPNLGERMCACVIPREGRTLALPELVGFLHDKEIARFKLPERLELMSEFPLSAFGKVSKQSLVAMVAARSSEPAAAERP